MKTLFAVSFAVVAALILVVSPTPVWSGGSAGFAHRPSVFPKPVDHWAHWGKPARHGFRHHGHVHKPRVPTFTVPHFTVPRPVVVRPHRPFVVAPRKAWVPGFWTWSGFYWVWIPGHWR